MHFLIFLIGLFAGVQNAYAVQKSYIDVHENEFFVDYRENYIFIEGVTSPVGLRISFRMRPSILHPDESQFFFAGDRKLPVPKIGIASKKPILLSVARYDTRCAVKKGCDLDNPDMGINEHNFAYDFSLEVLPPGVKMDYSVRRKTPNRVYTQQPEDITKWRIHPSAKGVGAEGVFVSRYMVNIDGREIEMRWPLRSTNESLFEETSTYVDVGREFEAFLNKNADKLKDKMFWVKAYQTLHPRDFKMGELISCNVKEVLEVCNNRQSCILNAEKDYRIVYSEESPNEWCYP